MGPSSENPFYSWSIIGREVLKNLKRQERKEIPLLP
jgi:hypothetical protein